jgi:hypothetical protein
MSKIIIYNYNISQSILNFFDVFESLPENEFKTKDNLELPRVIGSNENFEQLEESEATWYINKMVTRGFYLEEGLNIARYYNPEVYPDN